MDPRERDRVEEALRLRTQQLEAANRELAHASHRKSEFVANISHEMRTPLNSIIGFAELLLREEAGGLSGRQQRFISHIHRSGQHLLRLINDILDLSKVEAGKLVLQCEPLATSELLEEVVVMARGLAAKKAQHVEAEIPPELPTLRADPVRFKQICFNLLSNAMKFTPEGGRITLRCRVVDSSTGRAGESQTGSSQSTARPLDRSTPYLEISISDTGVGIRPEDLPRLFQEFVQLETTRAQRHEGTGLGLALTKRLVELHGGRIRAQSAGEGTGSTFQIELPLAPPSAPGEPDA